MDLAHYPSPDADLTKCSKRLFPSLIFRIVGVVSALDHMVEPKEIYNPTSPGPPYCGYTGMSKFVIRI